MARFLLSLASSALLLQAAMAFVPAAPLKATPTRGARFASLRMAATPAEYAACYKVRSIDRLLRCIAPTGNRPTADQPSADESSMNEQDLLEAVDKGNCAPIMVRLAWHDAGTFDVSKKDKPFPAVGSTHRIPIPLFSIHPSIHPP